MAATGTSELTSLVGRVLASLARDRPSAVRHPLGFLCLPVARDHVSACVHVWTTRVAQARPTTSPIHCHSWDLTSYVLYGTLRNELVCVHDDTDAATHRVFEIRSAGHCDLVVPTERRVRWERVATADYVAGDTYVLPAGAFHTTVLTTGSEAATVAFAQSREGAVDLSLGRPDLSGHSVVRERCGPAETTLALDTVLRRLAPSADTSLKAGP
jgi:hypothetical protein